MKLKKNFIIIIPSLSKNRYSSYGDLHPWGGSTLLEWKISQAKRIKYFKDIYVATPDEKIKKECKRQGVKVYSREKNESLGIFYKKIAKKFNKNYLLFLFPTSPFLSTKVIQKALDHFNKIKNKYDSLCSVQTKKEYFFYKKKSVNFDFKKELISRSDIDSLTQISNGMSLIHPKTCNEKKNNIGNTPYFFEIDWMSSLEINSLKDIKIYDSLINYYYNLKNF